MPDGNDKIISDYEKKHLQNIARTNERIREVFSDAIHTLTLSAGRIRFNGEVFDLSKYPALKAQIEEVIQEMGGTIYTALVNSIEASWGLANEKNDILVDRRLAGKKPTEAGRSVLYDPNKQALEAFINRKDKGLNLSDRVWKGLEPFKTELEKGLGLGIAEGKPAKAMATELKQFLNEPDKLFRRVRDAKGKLKLSKAAKEYHPGQGVYRSSFKNAARLTRTETNMAYRNADYERWQGLDFVTGIEVKLSNRHPEFDICDHVKGKYPKDFKFTGWHPQCLCHAVPLFATDEEYEKMEDAILAGEEVPKVKGIEDVPQGFKDYVKDNKERIAGWKNQPYWAKDNPEYFAGKQPAKVVELPKAEKPTFTPAKSIKDAEEWAVSKGYTKGADYSIGYTVEQANKVNQALDNIYTRFNVGRPLEYIETISADNAYADARNIGLKIGTPPYYVKDATGLNTRLKYLGDKMTPEQKDIIQKTIESVESGRRDFYREHSAWAFEDEYEAMVVHEMGHLIRFANKDRFDNYLKGSGFAGWGNAKWKEYAVTNRALDDVEEMLAESFALYYLGKTKGLHPGLIDLFKSFER